MPIVQQASGEGQMALPTCLICAQPFVPTLPNGWTGKRRQVVCGAEACRVEAQRRRMAAYHARHKRTPPAPPAPVRFDRSRQTPGGSMRPERVTVDGVTFKVCCEIGCDNLFRTELNSRKQETSRRTCDQCRERKARRNAGELPNTAGVPRCKDCAALVGLEWGGVTHLLSGLCPSCHEWREKAAERERRQAAGQHFAGGIWFKWRPPVWPAPGAMAPRPPKPEPLAPDERTLTTREAAAALGLGVKTVADRAHAGRLAGERTPFGWRLSAAGVEREVARRREAAEAHRAALVAGEALAGEILAAHGVTWEQARGAGRAGPLVAARAEVTGRLLGLGWLVKEIADLFGADHTTAINWLDIWRAAQQPKQTRGVSYGFATNLLRTELRERAS